MPHPVDAAFLALPLELLAEAALASARRAGASFADFRVHRLQESFIVVRDAALQSSADTVVLGYAVRVLVDGVWGFAASVVPTAAAATATALEAVHIARALRPVASERIERTSEPVYSKVTWVSDYELDPFEVPTAARIAWLLERSTRLLEQPGVSHTLASARAVKENGYYADTAGTSTTQQRVRIEPHLEATAVDASSGSFETMKSLAPPTGRGWEYLERGWDFDAELPLIAETLAEKLAAPSVEPGRYDLVIDPSNLFLTLHESVGHATEYDRAIGYEAAYAGTSFATPDQLGKLRYGSALMHVTADRTAPHGLASVGYDDDGVAAQAWDLVRDGVLVGYQLDRVFAHRLGLPRSNGCAYADSPGNAPMQRMPNVSLQPDPRGGSTEQLIAGVERGLYVVGDKSWSIDMQRKNFQFTGQRFYEIRGGKLVGQVKDVAYQATTTEFWGSLDGLGGPETYVLGGAFTCGKGQPGQVAPVSHGCPSARFRQVNVLNAKSEATA